MAELAAGDLFRLALEAAPTGMLMVGPEGLILAANAQVEEVFGYARDELLGKPLEILLPEESRARHPSQRASFFANPSVRPMAGRALFGLRKDGSKLPVEIGLNPVATSAGDMVLASVSIAGATQPASRATARIAEWTAPGDSDRTFRAAFEQSPIAMAILDGRARYEYVNAAWTRILGYEQRDIVGKTPDALTHPEDREGDRPLLQALTRGEIEGYTRQKRYLHRDGSVVHVLLHVAAGRDAQGATYYIGQVQDITPRVHAEQVVRALQSELARQVEIGATVLRNMPRGAVFLINREFRYLSAGGPSVSELLGMRADELPGRSVEEVVPERYRAEVMGRLRATLAGETLEFEAVRGERTYEVRTAPIYSGEREPVAALLQLYDVTERKQQALALDKERERFRALVENAPVGIFEMDAAGNMLYANDRWLELTGLSAEQARSPEQRTRGIHPDDRASLLAEWGAAVREAHGFTADFRYQPPAGKLKRLASVATPFRDLHGEPVGFLGVTLDMTAQVEAAEAVERSLREKETLLKEIHHRVKNNLQVIGSIIGLQANRAEDPRVQRVFDDIRGRIHAIALLHERLYRSPDFAAIDLLEYLEGLIGDVTRAAGLPGGRIAVRGPEARVLVSLDDAVPVGLIANELVTNALKHGTRAGAAANVTVELAREAGHVVLCVSDDGPGFPQGFAPETSKTLGLLLLRRLAKQLNGELEFLSHPTRGIVRFPVPGIGGE